MEVTEGASQSELTILSHAAQPIPARRQASGGIGPLRFMQEPMAFTRIEGHGLYISFSNHILHFLRIIDCSLVRAEQGPKTWDSLVLVKVKSVQLLVNVKTLQLKLFWGMHVFSLWHQ